MERQPTNFERRVYNVVKRVPRGRVTTYGLLAREVGCGSCRAIGQALKRNPYAPRIPCHRVIASDLTIGGYAGCTNGKQIDKKLALLKKEKILFRCGKLIDSNRIYRFQNR